MTSGHHEWMPLLLADRAHLVSPLQLYSYDELRMLGGNPGAPRWKRLRKGVYVARALFDRAAPWIRYAVRVHAFLRRNPDAVLCLESAAVVHGTPLFGETEDIHVYEPDRTTSWRHGDVSIHASADAREIVSIGAIRVTSMTDTIADLARVVPPAQGLAMADAALAPVQGGMLSIAIVRERGFARQSRRGITRMAWVFDNADGRAESPGESVSRAVIIWSGFERPELQKKFFYEGSRDRTDFYFPSCRAVGESDGWGKYELDDPEKAAQHLRDEKRREDRLRRNGHPFARWDERDARRVDPLGRALAGAGVPQVTSPDRALLATLRSHPRTRASAARPRRTASAETGPVV